MLRARTVLGLVLAIFVLDGRQLLARDNDAVWASLDAALRDGRPAAIRALTEAFSCEEQRIALTWLGRNSLAFSDVEVEEIYERFLAVDPDGPDSNGIREQLGLSRLKRLPREQRARVYWDALENGGVTLTTGTRLTATRALMRAAGEGLEEFSDELKRRAATLDTLVIRRGVKTSDLYLWSLRLGAGARDENDATLRRTTRLLEMRQEAIAEELRADSAFRMTVLMLAQGACSELGLARVPEACKNMARFAERRPLGTEAARPEVGGESELTGEGGWLGQLAEVVAPGRAELAKERGLRQTPSRRSE